MKYRAMTDALLGELRTAVVRQATEDYRNPGNLFYRKATEEQKEAVREEVLDFFRSDWYRMLCDIDPEYIIARLQEENNA